MSNAILVIVSICLCLNATAQPAKSSSVKLANKVTAPHKRKNIILMRPEIMRNTYTTPAVPELVTDSLLKAILFRCVKTQFYDICPIYRAQYDPYITKQLRRKTFDKEQLSYLAIRDANDALSLVAGVYQQKRGMPPHVDGGRGDGNLYIIDGMYILKN